MRSKQNSETKMVKANCSFLIHVIGLSKLGFKQVLMGVGSTILLFCVFICFLFFLHNVPSQGQKALFTEQTFLSDENVGLLLGNTLWPGF